jgi:hypothetical protein
LRDTSLIPPLIERGDLMDRGTGGHPTRSAETTPDRGRELFERVRDRRVAAVVALLALAGTGFLLSKAFGSSPHARPAVQSSAPSPVRTICTGDEGAAESCRSYFFPTHHLGPEDPVPKAGLEGDLIEKNGCILMDPVAGQGDPFLLIWPPDFRLSGDRFVQILDGEGNVVGRIGDHRFAGGGEIPEYWASEMARTPIPDDCKVGHYWLVADITPFAPEPEPQGTAGGTIFFPTWGPRGEHAVPAAGVYGILIERDGCLFLRRDGSDHLALWERGHRYIGGVLLDLDPSHHTIGRVGDSLQGTGGYYSDWKWAEEIVGEPIPMRCRPNGAEPIALIYDVQRGRGS